MMFNLFFGYLLMLLVMSYAVWLCVAVVAGLCCSILYNLF
jgi:hypothetical protein